MMVEDPVPGVGPVEYLRSVGRVDLVVGESLERPDLCLNVRWQLRRVLRDTLPSHASSLAH